MKTLTRSDVIDQIHANIDRASKDHLAGLLHAIIDRDELGPEALAFIARTVRPPSRGASSTGSVDSTATLAELAQGMVYREPEGKRRWMRIVEIGPVANFDSGGYQQYRDAVTQPAFSHEFVSARSTRIFGYDRPFAVKVAQGRDIA